MKKFLALIFNCVAGIIFAQDTLQYISSTQGAAMYEVCYYNNHLYAGAGNTLLVYKLDAPNQSPGTLTFDHRFVSNIDNIQERNGFLYVCANHAGLSKWKISVTGDSLQFITEYTPQSLDESVYHIAFFGDTIFAASKKKLKVLSDSANALSFKADVMAVSGSSRIRGVDTKGNMFAFTVGNSSNNAVDGVYLYNSTTLLQTAFYNQTFCNPEGLKFGQNTSLIHIAGGTGGLDGLYYTLDYSTPGQLNEIYRDTVQGILLAGFAFAMPMNITLVNDTVYVSTQGGVPIPFVASSCAVYVYDGTNSSAVNFLTTLHAGLYHFDVDINPQTRKMYVASEWDGILTVDINNIYNEVVQGQKLTGGWCHGSDATPTKLVQANEGYGVRLYNVSTPQNPVLVAEDTAVGFCRAISFTASGNYICAWYLTGDRLRVFDGNTLTLVNSINVDSTLVLPSDWKKSREWQGKIAVIEDVGFGVNKLVVADATVPAAPSIQLVQQMNDLRDLLFHPVGKLFLLRADSILVYDANTLTQLSYITIPSPFFQNYEAFALQNDTLFVYYSGLGAGLARYTFNNLTNALTYQTAVLHPLNSDYRYFLAADNCNLYLSTSLDSLQVIDKLTLQTKTVNDHGADFVFDNYWGIMDLYCKNGNVYLNEYYGQTSIFMNTCSSTLNTNETPKNNYAIAFPNPAQDYISVLFNTQNHSDIIIYDLNGKIILPATKITQGNTLNVSSLPNGFYVLSVKSNGEELKAKLIIQR